MQAPTKITIHVDEIIFHGFSPISQAQLREVIRAEVSRLLEDKGAPCSPARGGYVSNLDAGFFDMTAHRDVKTIGTGIARAIYGGLKR